METADPPYGMRLDADVSVPLRGLDMWKQRLQPLHSKDLKVSVPLRGLDMWKQWKPTAVVILLEVFQSPCGD